MNLKKWLSAALVAGTIFMGSLASAQTPCPSPCIVPPGTPVSVAFEHDGLNVTSYRVYLDGALVSGEIPTSARVSGTVTYALGTPGVGLHAVQAAAVNLTLETRGVTINFTISVPPPTTPAVPTGTRIIRDAVNPPPPPPPPPPPVEQDLMLSLSFNAFSGTVAADTSGNSIHGALVGGPLWTAEGRAGGSLLFDGVNDRVVFPLSALLDMTNAYTIEAWVYPTSTTRAWRSVAFKEAPGLGPEPNGSYTYALYSEASAAGAGAFLYNTAKVEINDTAFLPVNTWTHLAATYDGVTLQYFSNGILRRSIPAIGPVNPTAGPLSLGGNAIYGSWFAGRIDEVRIYRRALSAVEIFNDMSRPIVP